VLSVLRFICEHCSAITLFPCICKLWWLELNWRSDNSATLFCLRMGLEVFSQGLEIIKLWLHCNSLPSFIMSICIIMCLLHFPHACYSAHSFRSYWYIKQSEEKIAFKSKACYFSSAISTMLGKLEEEGFVLKVTNFCQYIHTICQTAIEYLCKWTSHEYL
jgi:hypothetical protein